MKALCSSRKESQHALNIYIKKVLGVHKLRLSHCTPPQPPAQSSVRTLLSPALCQFCPTLLEASPVSRMQWDTPHHLLKHNTDDLGQNEHCHFFHHRRNTAQRKQGRKAANTVSHSYTPPCVSGVNSKQFINHMINWPRTKSVLLKAEELRSSKHSLVRPKLSALDSSRPQLVESQKIYLCKDF